MARKLPIESLLPDLFQALSAQRKAVVTAPIGAGKSTALPPALLERLHGRVIISAPSRLAARLAATKVAEQVGGGLGNRVGYRAPFDDVASEGTRILFITDDLLLGWLAEAQNFSRPITVILDEFHARHVATDFALAVLRAKLEEHPKLELVVMTAGDEGEALARYLSCPHLVTNARSYAPAVSYTKAEDPRPIEQRLEEAVRATFERSAQGSMLVFLPTVEAIRSVAPTLAALERRLAFDLYQLHDDTPAEALQKAMRPGPRPRVILTTDLAESAIAVDGVNVVIDFGDTNVPHQAPRRTRPEATLRPASRAACELRCGHVSRVPNGHVVRMYTEASYTARSRLRIPGIASTDLCTPVLQLIAAGLSPEGVTWFRSISEGTLDTAIQRLVELGAIERRKPPPRSGTPRWQLSPFGQELKKLPIHPRLARLLVVGRDQGILDEASLAAALLWSPEIRIDPTLTPAGEGSDLDDRMAAFRAAEQKNFAAEALHSLGLASAAVRLVRHHKRHFAACVADPKAKPKPPPRGSSKRDVLGRELLLSFRDRVARRERGNGLELTLWDGSRAQLSEQSRVTEPFFVVLDAEALHAATGTAMKRESLRPQGATPESPVAEQFEPGFEDLPSDDTTSTARTSRRPSEFDFGDSRLDDPLSDMGFDEDEFDAALAALDAPEEVEELDSTLLEEQEEFVELDDTLIEALEEGIDESAARIVVGCAHPIPAAWMFEYFEPQIHFKNDLAFNEERGTVEHVSRICFGEAAVEESYSLPQPGAAVGELLFPRARDRLGAFFTDSIALTATLARLRIVREVFPDSDFPEIAEDEAMVVLRRACQACVSFDELRALEIDKVAISPLSVEQRALLREATPPRAVLPDGRSLEIHYGQGEPWIASAIEHFYGMRDNPTICKGKLSLGVRLLSPNGKLLQRTNDLAGFWYRHYAAVRRQLLERYPRQIWPEDPLTASPPPLRGARGHGPLSKR